MPIRTVKPRSDRGSLKDLALIQDEPYDTAPTAEELKLKQLYEHAQVTHDKQLQDALGFIVMPQAGDRSAFPITVYRHREYIHSLSQEMADKIAKTKQELDNYFNSEIISSSIIRKANFKREISRQTILFNGPLVKLAGTGATQPKRSFRRVS